MTVNAADRVDNTAATSAGAILYDGAAPSISSPEIVMTNPVRIYQPNNTTVYYGPQSSGELKLQLVAADPDIGGHPGSGIQEVSFPTLFGQGGTTQQNGSTYSASYDVAAVIPPTSGTFPAAVKDNVHNQAGQSFSLYWDDVSPAVTLDVSGGSGADFSLAWSAADSGAGTTGFYDVQYRYGGEDDWQVLLEDTNATQTTFSPQGGSVEFRVLAQDRVGNQGMAGSGLRVGTLMYVKYYTFGAQRAAMRRCPIGGACEAPLYLYGDHLGSVSLVTGSNEGIVSETRYLPYGEERWTSGESSPTDFGYTGQRKDGFGLMDYNARYYSVKLGRFISADSFVPNTADVKNFDRYLYTTGNPVKYIDPTGHISWPPIIIVGMIAGVAALGWGAAHAFGLVPDYRGIGIAEDYMNPQTDSIIVAAGIAVQSEWYGPWDTREHAPHGANSGLGIAQVNDIQMEAYGLAGQDQEDPAVAIQAMTIRIGMVQDACAGCTARDKLIAAALAQNGSGFTADSMSYVVSQYMGEGGNINWSDFFNEQRMPSDPIARLREQVTGRQYDTRLMLLLFLNDLRELYRRGWDLPEGITEDDLNYMYELSGSN